jgi:hypothetical protein
MTHVEFDINWIEVIKVIILMLCGALLFILFMAFTLKK